MAFEEDQLRKLDELLVQHPCTPSYSADLNDEEYTVQQKQWHKRVTIGINFACYDHPFCLPTCTTAQSAPQRVSNINFIANAACCLINEEGPFRMCSVGCGDAL